VYTKKSLEEPLHPASNFPTALSGRQVAVESAVRLPGTNDTINRRLRIQRAFQRPTNHTPRTPTMHLLFGVCFIFIASTKDESKPKVGIVPRVHSSLLCSFRTFPVVTFQFFTKSFQKVATAAAADSTDLARCAPARSFFCADAHG
jgi:hypothetical protein